MMPPLNGWTPPIVNPQRWGRQLIRSTVVLLGLTACTFDLDDPTGARQRRAAARRTECQQIYTITEAHTEQAGTAYEQGLTADGFRTQEGLLAEAEVPLRTAEVLETLVLEDENLQGLSLKLAAVLRQMAEAKQAMASFAEVERTITSANDRSVAHQAIVGQRDNVRRDYGGMLRALEAYCDGDEFPPALESSTL